VLRYLDRYVTVPQGSVFYITEALAQLEGLERGPAGNTSLTAAFALAQTMPEDQIVVVNETEYTGAGKHPYAQLAFAKKMGVKVLRGDPKDEKPGENIIIPKDPNQVAFDEVDLNRLRSSYIGHSAKSLGEDKRLAPEDVDFLAEDAALDRRKVLELLEENGVTIDDQGCSPQEGA
jgi:hypothetical protein